MRSRRWFVAGLVAGAAAAWLGGSAVRAGEGDAAGGGVPPVQKKIDHAFVQHAVGSWDTVTTMQGKESKGSVTFRLGLVDTAVVEDFEGSMFGGPFQGHGVWKVAEDGKSVSVWWIDNYSPAMEVYSGALTADGYDIKNAEGMRLALKKAGAGMTLQMFMGDEAVMSVVYTRKK